MALTDTDLQVVVEHIDKRIDEHVDRRVGEHVERVLPAMLIKTAPNYAADTQKLISRDPLGSRPAPRRLPVPARCPTSDLIGLSLARSRASRYGDLKRTDPWRSPIRICRSWSSTSTSVSKSHCGVRGPRHRHFGRRAPVTIDPTTGGGYNASITHISRLHQPRMDVLG